MGITPWIEVTDLELPTDPNAAAAVVIASEVLYALSGQRFGGVREITEWYECPCRGRHGFGMACISQCQTRGRKGRRLTLRQGPVHSIIEVSTPGPTPTEILPSTDYVLVGARSLYPTDDATWDPCDGLVVTYSYGEVPTESAKAAAKTLADQLVWARNGDDKCVLPERVTSISRQGVSWTLLDPQEFLADGRTGIYTIDLFLKTVNPGRRVKRARVFTPDLPQPRQLRPLSGP